MPFKTYASKSGATKGLARISQLAAQSADVLLRKEAGKWGFDTEKAEQYQGPVLSEEMRSKLAEWLAEQQPQAQAERPEADELEEVPVVPALPAPPLMDPRKIRMLDPNGELFNVIQDVFHAVEAAVDQTLKQDEMLLHMCGHVHCPRCKTHLDNGVADFDSVAEAHGSVKAAYEIMKHEWTCLGCGHEWGAEVDLSTRAPQREKGTGIKIEQDREERNGVKRPSIGGVCRAVWDWCDNFAQKTGNPPSAAQVKAAAEPHGWNPNNASIEYYQWRKFMGIRGRVK